MSFPSNSSDEAELPGLLITLSPLLTPLEDPPEDSAPLQNFDILVCLIGFVGVEALVVGLWWSEGGGREGPSFKL